MCTAITSSPMCCESDTRIPAGAACPAPPPPAVAGRGSGELLPASRRPNAIATSGISSPQFMQNIVLSSKPLLRQLPNSTPASVATAVLPTHPARPTSPDERSRNFGYLLPVAEVPTRSVNMPTSPSIITGANPPTKGSAEQSEGRTSYSAAFPGDVRVCGIRGGT